MHASPEEFLSSIADFLGGYYFTLAIMNAVAVYFLWQTDRTVTYFRIGIVSITNLVPWSLLTLYFLINSAFAFSGSPESMAWITLPAAWRGAVNAATGPVVYSVGALVVLSVMFVFRKFFVKPTVAWAGLNLMLLLMGLSITDPAFAAIVTKPDNVPIVGLVYLLVFFNWLSASKAVKNDERIKQGLEPLEKLDNEKVLVWPDLVYTEMICMVAVTVILIVWSIALQAPLEEMASTVKTPNPSKAPWYFLGLQEMLVYYDPWMAGVVAPSLVLVGLMAIPFLDFNKLGSGYYTIDQRKFAYLTFQFGFLLLWVTLIVLGTFLRGPNWSFFGPYELWDPHKVEALNNVHVSELFWIGLLQQSLPKVPEGAHMGWELAYIVWRELPGIALTLGYFVLLPPGMAATIFKKFFVKMGFIRYMVMSNLLLVMALLPIKMVLRWTLNLKYIIHIDEYFLNF